MKKLKSYNLLTLNGQSIVNDYKIQQTADNNWKATFCYDLSDSYVYHSIVMTEEQQLDNALFEQLSQVLSGSTLPNENTSERNKDILKEALVYVDFGEVFRAITESGTTNESDYKNKSKKDLYGKSGLEYRLQWLFDPENGMELTFDGNNPKIFVPFDKSSSMARNCQITFIDKNLKEKIEKRLLLDLDFTAIQVVPSKYYAYRGLYLSTGYRIEPDKKKFLLDQDSVIVVDDHSIPVKGASVMSANKKDPEDKNPLWVKDNDQKEIELNAFDGEGLICPDYAKYINEQLIKYGIKDSTSFQIRMPFVKGMLHKVDFIEFFSNELNNNDGKSVISDLKVTDAFGSERDLSKAKIILTKSMFKCWVWFEKNTGSELAKKDKMQYYFDKMKLYHHALYVTNIDTRLSGNAAIPLNYQFLSTLAIRPEDFKSICDRNIDKINDLNDPTPQSIVLFDKSQDEPDDPADAINSEENPLDNQRQDISATDKCLKALSKNDAFFSDSLIRDFIKYTQAGLTKDLGTGRVKVYGEQRFLSSDLLELLIHIGFRTNKRDAIKPLLLKLRKTQSLNPNHFYMPEKGMKLKADKYYCLLRNPHLSRNEQCMLKPYVPTENSLHKKYFSHLKGVVMVASHSMVPMALGGADFDGDLVKIIGDKRIVDAVKDGGAYIPVAPNSKRYKRNGLQFPVIHIPDGKRTKATVKGSVSYETIKNTFSNHIGLISNIAVSYAKTEYAIQPPQTADSENDDSLNCCAGCTIVAGLEIDAAKTGIHPTANINRMRKDIGGKDNFLKAKDAVKSLDIVKLSPIIKKEKKENTLSLFEKKDAKKGKEGLTDIPLYEDEAVVPNIDRLPGLFLNCLHRPKPEKREPNNKGTKNTSKKCFKFETDGWKTALEKEKVQKLNALIDNYKKVRTLAREAQVKKQARGKTTYQGYINTLLNVQYDDLNQEMPLSAITISGAMDLTYLKIRSCFKNKNEVKAALERMVNFKWHYTREHDRKNKLGVILGISMEDTVFPTESIQLLSTFRNNGFKLLYYILKDIFNEFDDNPDIEPALPVNNNDPASNNQEDFDLLAVYNECNNKKGKWKPPVTTKCREILKNLFGDNMDEALKYVYFCAPGYRFLWDVFTEEEILSNVYVEKALIFLTENGQEKELIKQNQA